MQAAVRAFPEPTSATPAQPEIVAPFAVNATVPVGELPDVDAMNVTAAPTVAGLSELVTVVLVAKGVDVDVQASTSTIRL